MRKLLIALACVLSTSVASAEKAPGTDLASTSFPAFAPDGTATVVRVTVTSRQVLRIRLEMYEDPHDWPPRVGEGLSYTARTRTRHLSAAVFDNLLSDIRVLSNAELEETFWGGFCQMVPSALDYTGELKVVRNYDRRTKSFLGEMARVMGSWCWMGYSIAPKDQGKRNRADRFKAKVKVLAAQFLGRRIGQILR
jgi:hypothetical protein